MGSYRSYSAYQVRVPGKWVLAGEHAVLRGVAAVALPHPDFTLQLRYEPTEFSDRLEIFPAKSSDVVRDLLTRCPGLDQMPAGRLAIESTIPQGAGLGSSAALCVAVTRWVFAALAGSEALQFEASIPRSSPLLTQEQIAFATRLEDTFHGRSSGMDIAVIAAQSPVRFVRGQGAEPLGIHRLPRFTFHDTHLRASTRTCIAQVEAFVRAQPAEARRCDALMSQASDEAIEGLRLYDRGQDALGLERIAQAMNRGRECFEAWGLIPTAARDLLQDLDRQGARAAKLTGAGGGGMVVALWE